MTSKETLKRSVKHWIGWKAVRVTSWLDRNIRLPFSDWNLAVHEWMERERVCCSRHGYLGKEETD